MKDSRLSHLNFVELLSYGGQPVVQREYQPPLLCSGYCTDCEENGKLRGTGKHLDKMSHGCDTSDYVALLGPVPESSEHKMDSAVMFLLDGPGGEYDLGGAIEFRDFKKRPPVNCYYWAPEVPVWPTALSEFDPYFYGGYFAYLMRRHGLTNVYITNATKCDWIDPQTKRRGRVTARSIVENCVDRWLRREIALFAPEVIFCFGGNAERIGGKAECVANSGAIVTRLYHPSAIAFRSQALGKTKQQLIDENDEWIASQVRSCQSTA